MHAEGAGLAALRLGAQGLIGHAGHGVHEGVLEVEQLLFGDLQKHGGLDLPLGRLIRKQGCGGGGRGGGQRSGGGRGGGLGGCGFHRGCGFLGGGLFLCRGLFLGRRRGGIGRGCLAGVSFAGH
ncbi:MAG: hypothetical protein EOP86_12755 [Verrucomicrobiaceae bacterium]|nr:MAG: hypothetical protein EOP86_12755 [Verrucomicrobiaceae bacterium]